jgi:hypothetical protein
MMIPSKQIDTADIERIKKYEYTINQLNIQLGTIEIQLNNLSTKKNEIIAAFQEMYKEEALMRGQLEAKYGSGTLDITKGVFYPDNKNIGMAKVNLPKMKKMDY